MAKIIDFIIIIFLIGLIIYLISTMFKPSKEQVELNKDIKKEIQDLISELKFKLKVAKKEAIEGKEDAVRKMTQYEQELIEAEELLKKYN